MDRNVFAAGQMIHKIYEGDAVVIQVRLAVEGDMNAFKFWEGEVW